MRVQQGSNQCSNNSCLSSTTTFVTETMFSMPIALADHTGGIEGVRLAGKAANELLTHTVSPLTIFSSVLYYVFTCIFSVYYMHILYSQMSS